MPPKKTKPDLPPYTIIIDTREQLPFSFSTATVRQKLDSADYAILGYEERFVIERKRNTQEIAQNVIQDRFYAELERLEQIENPFIICEFDLIDVMNYPKSSGMPPRYWANSKLSADFLLKRLLEIQRDYKTKWIFGSIWANKIADRLIKYHFQKFVGHV